MKVLLLLIAILMIAFGALAFVNAESNIHEIFGAQLFGFGFVLVGIVGIISAIEAMKKKE